MIEAVRPLCLLACLAGCSFSSPKASPDADDGGDGGGIDSGGQWVVVETLTIPADGTEVPSTTVLQAGVGYQLRAMGTYTFKLNPVPSMGDAEYVGFDINALMDSVSGVDVGLAVNDTTVDSNRTPRWGQYTNTHVYEAPWIGDGAVITAKLHDGQYADNSGTLTLQILALQ
jgi:hypothetical protein